MDRCRPRSCRRRCLCLRPDRGLGRRRANLVCRGSEDSRRQYSSAGEGRDLPTRAPLPCGKRRGRARRNGRSPRWTSRNFKHRPCPRARARHAVSGYRQQLRAGRCDLSPAQRPRSWCGHAGHRHRCSLAIDTASIRRESEERTENACPRASECDILLPEGNHHVVVRLRATCYLVVRRRS